MLIRKEFVTSLNQIFRKIKLVSYQFQKILHQNILIKFRKTLSYMPREIVMSKYKFLNDIDLTWYRKLKNQYLFPKYYDIFGMK